MAKTKLPWKLRATDYSTPGWHVRPTVGFELMFEFLRLSPSYELARQEAGGRLSDEDQQRLPSDFDEVRKVYALLGDLQAVLFRTWWLQRGLRVFGNPAAKPRVHEICVLPGGQDFAAGDVMPNMDRYLEEGRRDEGLVGALVVALPLGVRKADVMSQVSLMLDRHAEAGIRADKAILSLQGQRLRAKVLFNGIRLLWIRAARPKWELWRLGAKARLSPTYSGVLNPEAPRKVADDQEMIDREMMSKIASRALAKYEAIAENAARGRFPSDLPVSQAPFDYPQLAKIIQRKNTWEAREKARLLKAFEARAARRQAEQPTGI